MAKVKIPQMEPGGVFSLPAPPARKAHEYLTAYKSWVYTAVSAIAQDVSSAKIRLFGKKYSGGKVKVDEIMEHEALSLLYYANDFMTQQMLLEITSIYLSLVGEAYWAKLRDASGKVVELWPLRPDWVKVMPSKTGFIDSYVYDPGGNAPKVPFPLEDIVPFKDLNPTDAYRGYGGVQAGAMAIDTDEYSADWNRTFFYNSALPGLVFTTDKRITQDQVDRFKKQWIANFGGRGKGHKVAFLGGGMKPETITNTTRDMDFLSQRQFLRDEILAMFKVPKSIVGITEDVNRANAEATLRAYMERVITPRIMKLVYHLNEFYLTEWENDLFFDFDDPSPEDQEMNLKLYDSALTHGWMTINEIREKESLPPLEGGDTVYLPFNLQPITNIGQAISNALTGNKDDEQKGVITLQGTHKEPERKFMMPIPPKSLRKLRKESLKSDIKRDLHKLIVHTIREVKDEIDLKPMFDEKKKEHFWNQMIVKTDVYEERLKQMVQKFFDEQYHEVINNLELVKYFTKAQRRGKEDSLIFDVTFENRKWLAVVYPFIKGLFIDKMKEIFDMLGVGNEPMTSTETAAKFLEEEGVKFIKDVNATTSTNLKKTLAEGLRNNEGIDDLRKRVEEVFTVASRSRADMIARTEVLRATNYATLESYRQSDVVQGKEWLTALDERTCPICEPLNGVVVKLNKNFDTQVGALEAPPAHPNCRCTITPVLGVKKIQKTPDYTEKLIKKIEEKAKEKQADEIITQSEQVLEEAKKEAEVLKEEAVKEVEEERSTLYKQVEELKDKFKRRFKKDE